MQTTKDYIRKLLLETAQKAFSKRASSRCLCVRFLSCRALVWAIYTITIPVRTIYWLMCCVLFGCYVQDAGRSQPTGEFLPWHIYLRWISSCIFAGAYGHYNSLPKWIKFAVFSTQHSRLKDYLEEWIEKSATIGMEYMEKMRRLHPELHTDISPFFMHFTCSWWINMMKEVVQHKELSCEEIECFISEYIRFSTGGWKKLMNVKNERWRQNYWNILSVKR